MSSKEVSLRSITLKQYVYKLKGYLGLVYALIIAQVLGLLFSMNPMGSSSTGSNELMVSVQTHSTDIVRFFSIAWIFAIAVLLTTKQYKNIEFSLVSNRISSNLSNLLLLLSYAILGGITSTLIDVVQRIILYFTFDPSRIVLDGFFISTHDLMLGFWVTSLYMILISSIGYLLRTTMEINKIFAVIAPIGLVGLLRVHAESFMMIFRLFTSESSLSLFTMKIIMGSALFFGISAFLSNRMEVRK